MHSQSGEQRQSGQRDDDGRHDRQVKAQRYRDAWQGAEEAQTILAIWGQCDAC